MSSSIQTPWLPYPTRHRVDTNYAPGWSKENSLPITDPPPVTTAQLLWLGRDQAPRLCTKPTIFDDYPDSNDRDGVGCDSSSLSVVHEHHRPDLDHHVVKRSLSSSLTYPRFVHAYSSEITYSLSPTNLYTRYPPTQNKLVNQVPAPSAFFSDIRSLTTESNVSYEIMTTTIPSAPGSPPELSGSQSSNSTSSYCSSSPPGGDGIGSDITHYEDISLEDERPHQKPQLRSNTSRQGAPSHSRSEQPRRPAISNQIREAVKQHELETRNAKNGTFGSLRRGHTSTALQDIPGNARPRSASPPKRLPRVQSTSAMTQMSLRPDWHSSRSSLPLPPRRSSWNPRRKSAKELEAECEESDDELPEDASLWNVPVSPHPNGFGSSRSSLVGSPNRSPVASPRPLPLEHARISPDAPTFARTNSRVSARSRHHGGRSSSAHSARSSPSSPNMRHSRRPDRARSWNVYMEELSEEARVISESLEYHEASGRNGSMDRNGVSPRSSATAVDQIQLPPIQKGSLDFMPISKEKEAVLSRTRPSWLPPKDPKEEMKHLKEYQRMMAASLEADKKRSTKHQEGRSLDDGTREALARIWTFYIDSSTDLSELDPRVYPLCWRGVTPRLRGKVWKRAIGNQLGLTDRSYWRALERAAEIQSLGPERVTERDRQMKHWFKDIERDAETAFPELRMFQQKGPLWQDLVNVCKAYTCYRSDIGYIYGLQLVAALLLLQLPTPADAFVVLANALNRGVPLAFQSGDLASTTRTYNHAVSILGNKFPRVHDYLFGSIEQGGLGFSPDQVFEPMLRTLFANGLDVERLCRMWDIWVFEGDKILVHTAVALVGSLQEQLFEIEGNLDLKRRNIQEMLAWGPFNRSTPGEYWRLQHVDEADFVEEISTAGKLDYRGK